MQNLPVVRSNSGDLLANARDLHSELEVGRVFAAWIADRIDQYGFEDGEDYLIVNDQQCGKKPFGGRPTTEYHLTLDMAKELAMIENNDKGRQVRRAFIRMEKEHNKLIQALADHADKPLQQDPCISMLEVYSLAMGVKARRLPDQAMVEIVQLADLLPGKASHHAYTIPTEDKVVTPLLAHMWVKKQKTKRTKSLTAARIQTAERFVGSHCKGGHALSHTTNHLEDPSAEHI